MRAVAFVVFSAIVLPLLAVAGEQPPREYIEWCDIWVTAANRDNVPKVLLVGDSITRGYFDAVAAQLKDKADCARLATSTCVADPAFLKELDLLLSQYRFDVIHFNNGLHGYEFSEQQYRDGLIKALDFIREHAPQAKVIWANSTPVRQRKDLKQVAEETERIVRPRNRIAAEVVQARGIPVDDLFTLGLEHPEFYGGDGVHYNNEGRAAQGRQVAELVGKSLPKQ